MENSLEVFIGARNAFFALEEALGEAFKVRRRAEEVVERTSEARDTAKQAYYQAALCVAELEVAKAD